MATINQRGKSWVLNWREGGKQHRKSLGNITKHEAEAHRLAKLNELRNGNGADPSLTVQALSIPYLDWYETQYPANYDRTEEIFRLHILPVFGQRRIVDLTIRECEQHMLRRREEGAKRNTYIKDIRSLKALINKGIEWGYVARNPIAALKYPKELDAKPPRFYTSEELSALYCASPYHWHWWKLMANTGLRRAEAINLKWENIVENAVYIISEEGARTKSGRWRQVSLNEAAQYALGQFEKRKVDEYVYPRMHPMSMTRAYNKCLNRAEGIAEPRGSLHCLRHTFCSHLVMAGVPLTVIQKLAGHASYKTTERYAHVAPHKFTEAVSCIEL